MWAEICQAIAEKTGVTPPRDQVRSVGGGCINQCYGLGVAPHRYFVKIHPGTATDMFATEALALSQMAATQTIRVPQPICYGTALGVSYLVLEWLDLGGSEPQSWYQMGAQLAAMHRAGTREKFGWDLPNTIGTTPQPNPWREHWADFFAEERIGFQLRLANRRGGSFGEPDRLVTRIREILQAAHQRSPIIPSLLHGDLWAGNGAITMAGEPVIFDPASYYGDREADLAMTELFGGFPQDFYRGYDHSWAIAPGYEERKNLYNLYHVLNHFNLFGGGYGAQAKTMIRRILG